MVHIGGVETMKRRRLATIVAWIVIGGHVVILLFGMFVALYGRLELLDIVVMMLFQSPVWMALAPSMLRNFIRGMPSASEPDVGVGEAALIIVVPSVLIMTVGAIYGLGLSEYPEKEYILVLLGVVEIGLGGYLRSIGALFGE